MKRILLFTVFAILAVAATYHIPRSSAFFEGCSDSGTCICQVEPNYAGTFGPPGGAQTTDQSYTCSPPSVTTYLYERTDYARVGYEETADGSWYDYNDIGATGSDAEMACTRSTSTTSEWFRGTESGAGQAHKYAKLKVGYRDSFNVFHATGTAGEVDGCWTTLSPIIVSLTPNQNMLQMTDAAHGVDFDLANYGETLRVSWTKKGNEAGWLVLDRNHDGQINSGKEMFGSVTPQPKSSAPNGYKALAVFDLNDDGVIDANDAIFQSLAIWVDSNHDGVSQPEELRSLPTVGITSFSLNYQGVGRRDQFQNFFRFSAPVMFGDRPSRSWDVILNGQ